MIFLVSFFYCSRLKKDVKASSSILQTEKQEFFNGVQIHLSKDITDIKVGMESMKGDIKVIMDRQNRENPITANPSTTIHPVVPPPVIADTSENP